MKYIFIGDIHGRTNWKQIIEQENDYDKVIFFGDYFDPYNWTLTVNEIVTNFREILELKNKNPDKVILLLGNHDLRAFNNTARECRYMDGTYEQIALEIYNAIKNDVMQLCYFINEDIVCSHAGFSKTWLNDNNLILNENYLNNHFKKAVESKNISKYDFIYSNHSVWPDRSGDNVWQSPLWIRPRSLIKDKLENIIQIVGHNRINKNMDQSKTVYDKDLLLVDCLEHNEYYILEDDIFKFKKIKNEK